MMLRWELFGLCLAAGSAFAQADPLKSEACGMALKRLQALVAAASPRNAADIEKIEAARGHAAQLCLGAQGAPRERSGVPYPAQAVAPPSAQAVAPPATPAVRPQLAPATAAAPPVAPPPRAPSITGCDPAGCWDSDGRRLNNIGPQLMGPRGPCIVQGALVNCP